MKTPLQFLAVLTALAFSFAPCLARAQDAPPPPPGDQADQGGQGDQGDQGASFQTFYDQLSDQGNWVQTDDYGYVFQPNVTDPNWAPYTDGHWAYTDQGWAWVSDEPWGWATYHYGRWANVDGMGWVWVPGYRWAPAWVSWRYGGGYCGWAPLPPESFVGEEYGDPGFDSWASFHFGGDVDVNFNIGPGCYNFVRVSDFGESNYRGHFLDRGRNFAIINNTTNVTNININRRGADGAANFRGVAVGGPPINEINAHSRQHIPTVQLTAANQPGQSTLHGNSLAVFAPAVNPASVHQAKPTRVSQTIAHPTFNRGDSITKPLDVTSSVKPPAPTAAAIQAAQAAQLHVPAKAKVATENTTVKTPLSKPLTSLQSAAPVHHTTTSTTPAGNGFNNANTVNPNAEHSAANAPFTGEPVNKHPETQQNEVKPSPTLHPQNTVNPNAESSTANAPFTGEPVKKHSETQQNEATPKPAPTYFPQTQSTGNQVYHPSNTQPAETYHPQTQVQPQTEVKPTQTYHPQTQEAPAQTFHPQSQAVHEAPQPTHTQAAPAPAAAPAPSAPAKPAGGGGGDNKNAQGQGNNPQGH